MTRHAALASQHVSNSTTISSSLKGDTTRCSCSTTPTTLLVAIVIFFFLDLDPSVLLYLRCLSFRLASRAKSPIPCRLGCPIFVRLVLIPTLLYKIATAPGPILPVPSTEVTVMVVSGSRCRTYTFIRPVPLKGIKCVEARLFKAGRIWPAVIAGLVVTDTHCGNCFRSWILVLLKTLGLLIVCLGRSLFLLSEAWVRGKCTDKLSRMW